MKTIQYIIGVMMFFSLVSCTMETSDNGNLDGYWHLVRVDTLSTAGFNDLSDEIVFWAFQKDMLQLRGTEQELYMRFLYEGDQLRLSNPHLRDREKEDPAVTAETFHFLQPYGVNQMEEQMTVAWLDDKEMTLMTPMLRLKFRKY